MTILEILEESDMEYIAEMGQEIGIYRSVAESFPDSDEIQQRTRAMILYCQYEIDNTLESFYERREAVGYTEDI